MSVYPSWRLRPSAANMAAVCCGVLSHFDRFGSTGFVPLSNSTSERTSGRETLRRRRLMAASPTSSASIATSKCSVPIRSWPERRASPRALISTPLVRSEAKAHNGRRSGCLQSPETTVPMPFQNLSSRAIKIHHLSLQLLLGRIVALRGEPVSRGFENVYCLWSPAGVVPRYCSSTRFRNPEVR